MLACSLAIAQPIVSFTPFISGLNSPVDVVNAGDGTNRLFIVQKDGLIRIANGNVLNTRPFLNISSIIINSGEQGLLSMAFHPNYATNGIFFVYYNRTSGAVELARYRVSATNPDSADAASGNILLTIPKPFSNHNGGRIQFTSNGDLYVGTGDGGSGGDPQNLSQNLTSYLGKLLRISVNDGNVAPYYTVPADNPFVGVANTRPEIFAYGLRNPFRWSLDRVTGDFWIADVGQGVLEEVNVTNFASTRGANFGWRCYEGTQAFNLSQCGATPAVGKTFPIFEYGHDAAGGYSITGGEVYHGTQHAALRDWYLVSDYVSGNGWIIKPNAIGGYTVVPQTSFPGSLVAYGHGEDGEMYAVNLGGTITRIGVSGVLPVRLLTFSGTTTGNTDLLNWSILNTDNSESKFQLQYSSDGINFVNSSLISSSIGKTDYEVNVPVNDAVRYYRLLIQGTGAADAYSSIVKLNSNKENTTSFTSLSRQMIRVVTSEKIREAVLFGADGKAYGRYRNFVVGATTLNTTSLSPGLYFLRCINSNGESFTIKGFVQ